MTKSADYTPLLRLRCDPPDSTELEWTQDRIHLSRTAVCERAGLLGVPLRLVDLLIDRRVDPTTNPEHDPGLIVVLEVGERNGKHSGEVRDRWTWRAVESTSTAHRDLEWGQLEIDRAPGATTILVRGGDGLVAHERTYPSLRWVFDRETDASRVLWFHWNRHFRFLDHRDVEGTAASWHLSAAVRTVSEANRLAERELYRLARELGWRKMTLRERLRVWGEGGRDRPQWHRDTEVAEWISQTGVGEATLRAAGGGLLGP